MDEVTGAQLIAESLKAQVRALKSHFRDLSTNITLTERYKLNDCAEVQQCNLKCVSKFTCCAV